MNLADLLKSKAAQLPQNAHLHETVPGRFAPAPLVPTTGRTALKLGIQPSTDESKLNKTETAYLAWLRALGDDWIGIQSITFKIGADLRFTPDFLAINKEGLRAIDVKGFWKSTGKPHIEDDALVKIKVCGRLFPWCRFLIAWRDGAIWQHREIKP